MNTSKINETIHPKPAQEEGAVKRDELAPTLIATLIVAGGFLWLIFNAFAST